MLFKAALVVIAAGVGGVFFADVLSMSTAKRAMVDSAVAKSLGVIAVLVGIGLLAFAVS